MVSCLQVHVHVNVRKHKWLSAPAVSFAADCAGVIGSNPVCDTFLLSMTSFVWEKAVCFKYPPRGYLRPFTILSDVGELPRDFSVKKDPLYAYLNLFTGVPASQLQGCEATLVMYSLKTHSYKVQAQTGVC